MKIHEIIMKTKKKNDGIFHLETERDWSPQRTKKPRKIERKTTLKGQINLEFSIAKILKSLKLPPISD